MFKQLWVTVLSTFLLFFLASCGKSTESDVDLSSDDGSGQSFDSDGSEDALDSDSGTEAFDALKDYPTNSEEEAQAVASANDTLSDFNQAAAAFKKSESIGDFSLYLQLIAQAQLRAQAAAKALEQAGLAILAKWFYELWYKRDVLRFVNKSTGQHLYTLGDARVFDMNWRGMKLEGIIFRTYAVARPSCSIQLYRCRKNQDRYLSASASCDGNSQEGAMGYVCSAQKPEAWSRIARLYHAKKQDHLITTNQTLIKKRLSQGYRLQTYLGYAPN